MASTSAQYSLVLRVRIAHRPGMLGRVATAIGEAGGTIGSVDLISLDDEHTLRDITVDAARRGARQARSPTRSTPSRAREVVDRTDRTFLMHLGGKIEQRNKQPLRTPRRPLDGLHARRRARLQAIAQDRDKAFQYTIKRNTVAVVSDGTAVLGLGDIGPEAAMPVMEGKAMLFKEFGGVDAFPICLDTKDPDEIVATVKAIAPTFGGINLEDISAPRCFEIEERLKAELDIPVFHDDQHGTAVVVLAALLNAIKLHRQAARGPARARRRPRRRRRRRREDPARAPASRTSSAATRAARCTPDRADYLDGSMPPIKRWFAEATNPERRAGGPADVIDGADLFIGLSGARVMPAEALARMNRDAMVFAMANPNPEVTPEEAAPYARIIATGRSDYPNQINNVLCFPGIFRGALDVRAREITEEMKMAAARGIAAIVADDELREDYIIPSVFNRDVADSVAAAVAAEAKRQGAADGGEGAIGYAAEDAEKLRAGR